MYSELLSAVQLMICFHVHYQTKGGSHFQGLIRARPLAPYTQMPLFE